MSFFSRLFRKNCSGDEKIKEILDSMDSRDLLVRISKNHWKITRAYESGRRKWAEFLIQPSKTEARYTVTINNGKNTRIFYRSAKEYPANFPHKILKKNLIQP